jgi:hypothetical protein
MIPINPAPGGWIAVTGFVAGYVSQLVRPVERLCSMRGTPFSRTCPHHEEEDLMESKNGTIIRMHEDWAWAEQLTNLLVFNNQDP